MGAESGSGSTSLNAIPKSGSNTFAGGLDGYFSNGAMQSGEYPRQPERVGARATRRCCTTAAINSAAEGRTRSTGWARQLGGPIKQDKIWFFAAIARWGSTVQQPSAFYNPLQGKANVPGAGVVGPTPTLFYPGQPGSPYANVRPTRDPSFGDGAGRPRASTGIAPTPAASPRR